MLFKVPGKTIKLRLFERVETTDPQYHIYDIGIQHECGGIDSVAAGGSFHSAEKVYDKHFRCDASEATVDVDASSDEEVTTDDPAASAAV